MKTSGLLAGAMCLFLAASSAWADATVESNIKFGGFKGNGAYEGTTALRIQGDRQSESSAIKFTGAIMSWAAGGSENTTITRIDKGVVWVLDPKKKSYTQSPIALFKPEEPTGKKEETNGEKPKVRVSKSEFTVKKTGASQTINGFVCEEYLMTWILETENLETKARTKNTMTTNLWTTPETASIRKVQAEEAAFAKAYMKKMGMNLSPEKMKQYGMGVFSMSTGASEKDLEKEFSVFKKEMAKVKGYPIKTMVNWKVEGDKAAAPINDSADSPEPVDVSGGLGGIISGIIGQKVKDGIKPDENAPFFSSTTEVKAIHTDKLPAGTFEIPSGYVLGAKNN